MRLLLAAVWILLGAALTGGVYWGFLVTPESTIWTLMLSAVLAMVSLALTGFTANGAIAILRNGLSLDGVRRAIRAIPGVIPAALIVLLLWWIAGRAEASVSLRSGQISAWFIARFGWDDMTWLFTAVRYLAQWLRWVIASLLALSLLAGIVAIGWRSITQFAWLRRALHPRAVIVATIMFAILIAIPWTYLVPWRPQGLPASSVEFVFIAAKLSLTAILFALGATLITREASR
ncbi:MAG TPA: hypothetical protein VF491_19845 [Vicinamibacterales bacterium]